MELMHEFVGVASDNSRTTQYALGDNANALTLAKDILADVFDAYSGYNWFVQVKGGVIFIRELTFPKSWGMARKLGVSDFSRTNLKHDVVMSAGEWLERCKLRRGLANQGEEATWADGVPEKDQPVSHPIDATIVMPNGVTPLRTEPRPQVMK